VSIRGSNHTTREVSAGQISGWKAQATIIRVHSCSFVVQNTPREAPSRQISHWQAQATFIRVHSCPFVSIRGSFVSIRGSKHPSRSAFRTDLRLVSPSYIYSWFIHVHSWFKKRLLAIIRENPCSSVAKKTPVAPHPRTPVRGSPDEHTPRVISTSRLRVSPNDPKPPALTL
jgi:hypothetical protein